MKGILTSYKINEKYLSLVTWAALACIVILALIRLPLSSLPVGDEDYYRKETAYLAQYGLFNSLSQGTSVLLSCLIYICSKVFFTDFLVGARILSIISFLVSCRLLYQCAGRFSGLSETAKHFAMLAFAGVCYGWLWKGLADIVSVPFFLAACYYIAGAKSNKAIVIAALCMFCGFAVKPTILMAMPGVGLAVLVVGYRQGGFVQGLLRSMVFGGVFLMCFGVYHIPGYRAYGKLMLESKDHSYVDGKRIENKNLWYERIVYFEQYNVNHKPNKWQVTWDELDTFKARNPEVNLNLGFVEYIRKYPASYFGGVGSKVFLTLPYSIQYGFFFAKWTVANKFIHSYIIIKLLTLLLIAGICVVERRFIKENALLLLVAFSYYLILSVYVLSQLEDNWLLLCLPLLALPVVKFLADRVNILLLVALQIIYLLL